MTRWAVAAPAFAIALVAACERGEAPPAQPLARALLAAEGAADPTASLAKLAFVAGRVRRTMRQRSGQAPIAAINHVVFEELGFAREVDDHAARFSLLSSVLTSRRGDCVGLGSVYLALGETLGLDIKGVLVPGHFFVRVLDARGSHNVELLRRGEEMPDAWYLEKYAVPAGAAAYLRPLSRQEVLAVVHYNLGNDLRARGRMAQARAAYDRAAVAFPGFAEAHANLGLLRQLQGDLVAAEHEYLAARAANPALAGLKENLVLLDTERGTDSIKAAEVR